MTDIYIRRMKEIQDEFTHLKISRARKWQMRQEAKGKCRLCPKKSVDGYHCKEHQKAHRERCRIRARKENHIPLNKPLYVHWKKK